MDRRSCSVEGLGMNASFWKGKRVFLTGHTGFKGSWLAIWLQALGTKLTGFALPPPTTPNLFDEARVNEGMSSVNGDIRDLPSLQSALRTAQPEIVIHMAAQALVRESYENPVETYATNVMGTVHVLESVRHTDGVRGVVIVTTDKCYANKEWVWGYREDEPMGGHDPYSSSKGCAELVSSAYRSSFFSARTASHSQRVPSVATVRAGNVIGGGDWAKNRLVPDIIAAFDAGRPVSIRSPNAIRPWQHVLEPLRGYLMVAERLFEEGSDFAEAWNFGPADGDTWPVSSVVEHMAALWGNSASWHLDTANHPHEAAYLKLDSSKARQLLGWRPVLSLRAALELVVDWHQQRRAEGDVRMVTNRQIAAYSELQNGE